MGFGPWSRKIPHCSGATDLDRHNYWQVKNLPAMQETRVQSLDWENPLEEGTAMHSSILAWRVPWTEEPSRLQPVGLQSPTRVKRLSSHAHTHAGGGC